MDNLKKPVSILKNSNTIRLATEASVGHTEIVVNQTDGPYKTISAALDEATPYTTILIHSGLYSEQIRITKPNIRLQPVNRTIANDIILLNNRGPSIEIDIPKQGKCEIYNFKVTNTAKDDDEDKERDKEKQKERMVQAFAGAGKEFLNYDKNDPRGWEANTANLDREIPCLVRVYSGQLVMKVTKINPK